MWTQLVDASRLNRIGPDNAQAPSEFFLERQKKHAERLAQLEQLRAARLATETPNARRQTPKARRRA